MMAFTWKILKFSRNCMTKILQDRIAQYLDMNMKKKKISEFIIINSENYSEFLSSVIVRIRWTEASKPKSIYWNCSGQVAQNKYFLSPFSIRE